MADNEIEVGFDASRVERGLGAIIAMLNRTADVADNKTAKALSNVEKAVAGAAAKNGLLASSASKNASAFASMKRQAADYTKTIERLSHLEGAQKTAGGRYRSQSGQFVKASEVREYQSALRGVNALESERVRLLTAGNRAQAEGARQMKAAKPVGYTDYAKKTAPAMTNPANTANLFSKQTGSIDLGPTNKFIQAAGKATEAAKTMGNAILNASNSTRYVMYDVSASMAIAGAAVAAFGVASTMAAVSYESAFAAVDRTVQTDGPEALEAIRRQLIGISQDAPVAFKDLAEIASLGGQMGISAAGIGSFTETIAKLTATTNLTADAAGTALGRFKSFFSEVSGGEGDQSMAVTEATFGNLASSILKVGVNSVATESGIVNVATQISSMGTYAGLTATQVVGLAGALSSVGVPPELSRGVTTRLFTLMGKAVSGGGAQLSNFARVAGISATEFEQSWGTSAFGDVVLKFMKGLHEQGNAAVLTLNQLGITGVRDTPVLLRLAGAANEAGEAGMLLSQTMADAGTGWEQNTELAVQYNKVAQTTQARLSVLGNAFTALFASLGQNSNGVLKDVVNGLIDFVNFLEAASQTPFVQFMGSVVLTASLVTGALFLVTAGVARTTAAVIGLSQAWKVAGDASTRSAALMTRAGLAAKIALIGTGVGAAVVAIGSLVAGMIELNNTSSATGGFITDTSAFLAAMKEDAISAGSGFVRFKGQVKNAGSESDRAGKLADNMSSVLYGVKDSSEAAAKGMNTVKKASEDAGYAFGDSAAQFVKGQLAMDDGFQDMLTDDTFVDYIETIGFDIDKALQAAAKDGSAGVEKYINKLRDAYSKANFEGDAVGAENFFSKFSTGVDSGSSRVTAFSDKLGELQGQAQGAVNAAELLAGATRSYSSATEIAAASTEELAGAVGDDLVDRMAKGIAKFTDMGQILKFTQEQMAVAAMKSGEDQDKAAADAAKAWDDYYGGQTVNMDKYLENLRRASDEQSSFNENLTNLSGRGISEGLLVELAEMGPAAAGLVQGLVDSTDAQLEEFEQLWGDTGYESMVRFAAQTLSAQGLVQNVLASAGQKGLEAFTKALASGKGIPEALQELQLDVNGKPLIPKLGKPDTGPANAAIASFYNSWNNRQVTIRVNASGPGTEYQFGKNRAEWNGGNVARAVGGYTGPGSKYKKAGDVHAGEFVFTKEATSAIGVGNLYAQMRSATQGVASPMSSGYASGGMVSGGGFSSIDAGSIQALAAAIRGMPLALYTNDRLIAEAANRGNAQLAYGGSA